MDFQQKIEDWMRRAEEFGCRFDNVRFEWTAEAGVRVMAVRPQMNCCVKVGRALLVPRDKLVLTDSAHYVAEDAGLAPEAASLVNEMLDFILSDERVAGFKAMLTSFAALPEPLKVHLRQTGLAPALVPESMPTDAKIKAMLIQARVINWQERTTFMPFVDFVNHDRDGIPFDMDASGIAVRGRALEDGHLYALYSAADSFNLLNTYGFAGKSHFAWSVGMGLEWPRVGTVRVGRRFNAFEMCDGLRVPEVVRDEDG
ncbi:MAG: hypothetical protein Q9M29_05065, partial [Mariprofundaceae bacterium]|nr:hypothetical protein [Mariprofundaceae bacterium]